MAETRCLLCDREVEAIAAIVIVGDLDHPDDGALCRRCAALSSEQRRAMRDEAMVRALLRNGDGE